MALPRFTMTDNYGDLDRLEIIARTRPLPVHDVQPESSLLTTEDAPVGFSLDKDMQDLAAQLRCFASNQGRIETHILGKSRIEIRPHIGYGERLRINCTAPIASDDPDTEKLRWIGFLLSLKDSGEPKAKADDAGINTPVQDEPPAPPE